MLFSSVQSLSSVWLFTTPWIAARQASLSITQTHVHRVSDAIQPSHPLSSPSPPAPNPSQHQSLFQWVNSSHEVAKVLEFQLQHHSFQHPSKEIPGLISFRMDWLDLCAVQGTLKSFRGYQLQGRLWGWRRRRYIRALCTFCSVLLRT